MTAVTPEYEGIFIVRRNPRDPALPLVDWQVIDSRTQATVASHPDQPAAVTDMQARNRTEMGL